MTLLQTKVHGAYLALRARLERQERPVVAAPDLGPGNMERGDLDAVTAQDVGGGLTRNPPGAVQARANPASPRIKWR